MKIHCVCLITLALACHPNDPPVQPIDPTQALQLAGQAKSELDRLGHLRNALDAVPSGDPLRFEILDLIEVAEHIALGRDKFWVPGEQDRAGEGGYSCAFFTDRVWPAAYGDIYPAEPRANSPTRPIWSLFRGRMMIWQGLEHGIAVEELYAEGRQLIQVFAEAFPDHPDAQLYLGEGLPWAIAFAPESGAPQWANLQREALVRLQSIIDFWIDERQAPDGQFGGGWGDDVELWRRWTPVLLGFDHAKAQDAQQRLAEGIFGLERLRHGYTNVMSDVEHSAEDTSDPLTLALLIDPNSDFALPKSDRIGELARSLWMTANDRNQLQFRSTYFTATQVDSNRSRACDTAYHTRALQPLIHRWRHGDTASGALLSAWLRMWRTTSLESSNGKPAGLIPSSIRFPSGEAGGSGDDWWDPGCHITHKTFAWPRAVSMLAQALVVAAEQTNNNEFMDPLTTMVDYWRAGADQADRQAPKGSEAWLIARIPGLVSDALSWWRARTGDQQFDDVLDHSEPLFSRALRTQNDQLVVDALARTVSALSIDFAAHTREVLFTDRFLKFHRNYANAYRQQQVPKVELDLLYSMLTGGITNPTILGPGPLRWNLPVEDLAVWVRPQSTGALIVDLYAFAGTRSRAVQAQLVDRSFHGATWTLQCDAQVIASGHGQPMFDLPRRRLCQLSLAPP